MFLETFHLLKDCRLLLLNHSFPSPSLPQASPTTIEYSPSNNPLHNIHAKARGLPQEQLHICDTALLATGQRRCALSLLRRLGGWVEPCFPLRQLDAAVCIAAHTAYTSLAVFAKPHVFRPARVHL